MRLGRRSGDGLGEGIEDRRGGAGGGFAFPGGRTGAGGGGLGGAGVLLLLLYVVVSQCLGGGLAGPTSEDDYGSVFGRFPQAPASGGGPATRGGEDDTAVFVGAVVDDVQETWAEQFRKAGKRYQPTVLVLFDDVTRSGCGLASRQTGPFHCPLDSKVYVDQGFFRELDQRFGAPGDFAQAYVIAHEFGHHVENLLGVLSDVSAEQRRNPARANDLSIRVELAADAWPASGPTRPIRRTSWSRLT